MKTLYKKIVLIVCFSIILNYGYGQKYPHDYYLELNNQLNLASLLNSIDKPENPENNPEFLDSIRYLPFYDGKNKMITYTHDSLGRKIFDSYWGYTYSLESFDNDGKLISKTQFTDNSGNIDGAIKSVFEYDNSGKQTGWIEYIYSENLKQWGKTGYHNYIFNDDNFVTSEEGFTLDSVTGEFYQDFKSLYYFENGKHIKRVDMYYDTLLKKSDTLYMEEISRDSKGRALSTKLHNYRVNVEGIPLKGDFVTVWVNNFNENENSIEKYTIEPSYRNNDTIFNYYLIFENSDFTGPFFTHHRDYEGYNTWIKGSKKEFKYEYDENGNMTAGFTLVTPISIDSLGEHYGNMDTTDRYYYNYDEKNRLIHSTNYYYNVRKGLLSLEEEKYYYYRPDPAAIKIETQSETAIAITFNRYIKPNENLEDLIDIIPVNLIDGVEELQIVSASVNLKNSQQIFIEFSRSLVNNEEYTIATNTELDTYDNNVVMFSFQAAGLKSSVAVNELTQSKLSISQSNDMIVLSSPVSIKQVEVLSASGSKITSLAVKESNTVSVNTSGMAAGVYMLVVNYSNGNSETVKVVVK